MEINRNYLVTDRNKHGGKRKKPVRVLIPHHNGGVAAGKNIASFLKTTNRQVSTHYVIGQDGEVFNTLDESLEPYTTGDRAIDTEGITFEVANSTPAPGWQVTNAAFDSLVNMSIDICKRYGIKEVFYTGDKRGNIHLHEWYQPTNCPGPYLKSKMPEFAKRVNEGLGKTQDKPSVTPPPLKPISVIAKEVIAGLWGNGNDRVSRLAKAGYNYASVQAEVNRLLGLTPQAPTPAPKPQPPKKSITDIAREVNLGSWGNGADRKKRLEAAGYNYNLVQVEVNRLLGGSSNVPAKKSVTVIAREVLNGNWGNGSERKRRLEAAGYNYNVIQSEVNRLL